MASVIVCHACDLVHRRDESNPGPGYSASLQGRVLQDQFRQHRYGGCAGRDRADTAALSNVYPLVSIDLNGSYRDTTLLGAALALYGQGYAPIAALVVLPPC